MAGNKGRPPPLQRLNYYSEHRQINNDALFNPLLLCDAPLQSPEFPSAQGTALIGIWTVSCLVLTLVVTNV